MSELEPQAAPAPSHRFDIYGLGNALVDQEFVVHDEFLRTQGIAKGAMTLIDEPRLVRLLADLRSEFALKGRASGGSAKWYGRIAVEVSGPMTSVTRRGSMWVRASVT